MIRNYFKTAWRNMVKNKAFSLINISGLTIGIAVCMMIFLYILNEFSADRFHKNGNRIYRVMREMKREGKSAMVAYLSGPYAPALENDFKGQFESIVRANPTNNLVTIGNRAFNEKKVIDADNNFFTFFSYPLVEGDRATVLKDLNSVVLSQSIAKKYFGGSKQAMGKTILMDKSLPLKVTGVMRDVPSNSHLDFNIVVPIMNYRNTDIMNGWLNNGLYTYVLLAKGATKASVEKQFPAFMEKYMGETSRRYGYFFNLRLTALKDVYFENNEFDNVRHGDRTVVYVFISIAVLILLIACINFVNLSTVRAAERSKEVGLRKVLGAMRNNLIGQFIGESVLFTLISCALALMLLWLVKPMFDQLVGYPLSFSWRSPSIYLFLGGVVLAVGILAGSYPAFFLSAFSPVKALKGRLRLGKSGAFFRQALVVLQFSISVFLIVGVLVIARQMSFMKNKQLGYNNEQTVILPIDNEEFYNNLRSFKTRLQEQEQVRSVSFMSGEPGGYFDRQMFDVEGQAEKWAARSEYTDFEFAKTLGLKVIAGRDFSAAYPTDSTQAMLMNREAAAKLGWTPEQAIGKWIKNTLRDSTRSYVVGVVENFNFQSLRSNIEPLVITPSTDLRTAAIKLKPGNVQGGLSLIEDAYAAAAPGHPFEYRFLDTQFGEMYQKDIRQQTLLALFAGLAIFVACLGLFGLASFTATKRFKEIGVRKVLGSSVQGIVVLLSKDLLKPVLVATAIALPLGYMAMNLWLQEFAYKISSTWWIYLLAALTAMGIALLTVSVKAIQAALANPVKSLRTE